MLDYKDKKWNADYFKVKNLNETTEWYERDATWEINYL